MPSLSEVVEELSAVLERPVAEKLAQVMLSVYQRLHEDLVLQRLESLENAVRELIRESQRSREETDARFRELAEAQRRTDERLGRLAEEFAEYRKETDARFRELAEAQRRTEEALLSLAETVKDVQRQLGGLSQTVGYVLENEALKKLPKLLLRDYGVRVQGKLKRLYVTDRTGRSIEVNVFGTGKRDGETVTIIGESKSQLSKNDIDRFLRRTIGGLEGLYPQILPVLITHMTSEPDAEEYARRLGVALYYSYDF
ncbi:MAG: chordopoxvirus fusion protein [Armatimonadota bacterium]